MHAICNSNEIPDPKKGINYFKGEKDCWDGKGLIALFCEGTQLQSNGFKPCAQGVEEIWVCTGFWRKNIDTEVMRI